MSSHQVESAYRDQRANVEINVGKVCNNKCVFCLDGMPSKEDHSFIPFERMREELERFRQSGHLSVGFLGGEPTTYPKIIESVAYAKELGFTRVALATNALMLRREAFVDQLLAAGLTRVTISMHGHTAELEDRLTMVPGSFEKKCTAIALLLERKRAGHLRDGVSVNVVLNGWNYRHLLKMQRFFFEQLGLDDLRVNFVRPEGYAQDNADLVPTFTDAVPYIMKAIALNELHYKRTFTFGGVPMCVLPEALLRDRDLLSRSMGDVYRDLSTSCSVRSSHAGHDGVSETDGGRARFNWQDRKRFDLKYQPVCETCVCSSVCEGVWRGHLDIYETGEFAPLTQGEQGLTRAEPETGTRGAPDRSAPSLSPSIDRDVG